MTLHHSLETHQNMLQRIPEVTGRRLPQWFETIENGPALLRFEDRVNWLKTEHGLSHGHATALVHEHDQHRRRAV